MSRPSKIKKESFLRKIYCDMKLSTTEISARSNEFFGQYVSVVTVFKTLKRMGIIRTKSESIKIAKRKRIKKAKLLHLSEIVRTNQERWNARWLVSSGKIKPNRGSMFIETEAEKLRKLLDIYGEANIVPQDLINEEVLKARRFGFPFYDLTETEKKREWELQVESVVSSHWSGQGTRLASTFHPHFFECRKRRKMSPIEFFNSDSDLKRGIWKLLCLYGKISKSKIREICRNETKSSRVNNFPPRVAKIIAESFPGSILDPCAGFGGRMIGCASASKCKKYTCIELSPHSYKGLIDTSVFLAGLTKTALKVYEGNCLMVMPGLKSDFDLVFTSPPFLDVEQYKDVPFESDYDKWMTSFIKPFVSLCFRCLKDNGKMVLYLENIRGKNFREDTNNIAKESGFVFDSNMPFSISYGENIRHKKSSRTIEIQVWRKHR